MSVRNDNRRRTRALTVGNKTALVLLAVASLLACRGAVPSGFWKGYRSDLIAKQSSDQGPWGGSRWILWESQAAGTFSESDARTFAEKHGWKFLGRVELPPDAFGSTSGGDKPITSSLFHAGYDAAKEKFPRFIRQGSVMLKFDSGWMREDAGTNEMSTAFGYLQVSKDGRQMLVYHLWGNS